MTILRVFGPYLHKRRQVIGGVGPASTPSFGNKSDLLVFYIDEIIDIAGAVFFPNGIQDFPGFFIIINTAVISPSVGSKQKTGDTIQFPIRSRTLGIFLHSLRIDTPG